MTECPSCAEAEINPDTGMYHTDCPECTARGLAHGHPFWESALHMKMMPAYIRELKRIVGEDAGERDKLHFKVKAWAQRIDEARRK